MIPNSQKVETPKCPVVGELIHTWKHHSAMERREALTLATTWTDPEDMVLSERSRHRRTHRVTPLMGNVQSRQICRHREWVPGGQGLGQGMG